MRLRTILILLLAPSALASCVQTASSCAGWQKIQAGQAAVEFLAARDPAMLRQVIAHDEFGRQAGCWK